jgi:protease IV
VRRLLAVVALALVLASCRGRPGMTGKKDDDTVTSPAEPHVAELDLRDGVGEAATESIFGPSRPTSYADLVTRLRDMAKQDRLRGVFVRLGLGTVPLARADELGRLLGRLRADGKPVVCHADGYVNSNMLLAARGCDEIWLSPAGSVDTVGLAAQLVFGKSALEKFHLEAQFLQEGRFKGAKEPFTRDEASPEARESLVTTLRALRQSWIDGVQEGRNKSADALALEDGPHTANEAKERGLIDAIGFEREARAHAFERAGVTGKLDYFGGQAQQADGVSEIFRVLAGTEGVGEPHIAIVPAIGGITVSAESGLFGGGGIVERRMSRLLHRLERDDDVKAVVLRIDSPGGSALASDLLWRQLMDLRAVKPLVISVGGMAASGGYYLASAGTRIVAERTSILGSIGVVAGKVVVDQGLAELGVHVETIAAREGGEARAAYGSPMVRWDDATLARLDANIKQTYQLFLARISEGRGIPVAEIEPAAEGRIMGGADALAAHLCDELGGLDRSIDLAVELAGVDPAITLQVVRVEGGFLGLLGMDSESSASGEDLGDRIAARAATATLTALLPFPEESAAFAESTMPLLRGERVLAAVPFVLAVR